LFHETVRASCGAFSVNSLKGNDSETRRFRDRLTLQGSKPQRTTESEPFHKRVQELMDRHLHTHGFKYIDPSEHGNPPDIWDFWRKQVDEMNELCRLNGEPWAWEYLWKEWYSPRRWVLWGRAASLNIYPIINSNASVEALWTTLKRFYLRRHPRASLERIWNLITNDFI